jgi:hypothetical protein
MRTISRWPAALILCFGLLVAAAHAQQALPIAQQTLPIPWLVPSFAHHPPDDSVVFGSLLEAAGSASYRTPGPLDDDWVGVAAGNFCGGSEKELVVLQNTHSNFSVLRGPAPFVVGTGDLPDLPTSPPPAWRGVAAGNLDGDDYDKIVAIRGIPFVPNLVVAKASSTSCEVSTVVASKTIGDPHSGWVGVAVGDFDGTGRKQIALLKGVHFSFVKLTPTGELSVFHESDLDSSPTQPWKALAAGDIDGDGVDELIAVRQVGDGQGATVLAYKWNGSGFTLFATSTFGNNGNSNWSSAAVGDFNGDGRQAIVLVKNQHSNFVVLDYPEGATQLRILSTADLDSLEGRGFPDQPLPNWRGLAATDWLRLSANVPGASQLIAVRVAHNLPASAGAGGAYRTNVFVYGDPLYRAARNTALDGTKAQWDHDKSIAIDDLKDRLRETHTNTLNFLLWDRGDYPKLVEFLNATRGFFVDGKQLRVWVSLAPPTGVCTTIPNPYNIGNCDPATGFYCALPEESPLTAWSEANFFRSGLGIASCQDYLGWASLIGRLAQDYPQLVAAMIDDFFDQPFTPDFIAEFESRMRSQAPWLNFVPSVYYHDFKDNRRPDTAQTFDTMLFWFRNEKEHACLADGCGEASVGNAPGELTYMSGLVPAGRKLQVGVYWGPLYSLSTPEEGSARYDYDLVSLVLSLPWLGGATAYPAQTQNPDAKWALIDLHMPANTGMGRLIVPLRLDCTELNYLAPELRSPGKYCTLMKAYGSKP